MDLKVESLKPNTKDIFPLHSFDLTKTGRDASVMKQIGGGLEGNAILHALWAHILVMLYSSQAISASCLLNTTHRGQTFNALSCYWIVSIHIQY